MPQCYAVGNKIIPLNKKHYANKEYLVIFAFQISCMKNALLILIACSVLYSCDLVVSKRVSGNGTVTTQERSIASAEKIKVYGSFDVDLVPSANTSIKVEADDNLMQYIVTREEGGWLVIKPEEHINLSSSKGIKITVNTPTLEALDVAGSANVRALDKFTKGQKLEVDLSGSGNVWVNVNTPEVYASIAGSGVVQMKGETRNLKLDVSGSGDFKGNELMSENVDVDIAGSGDVSVYADGKLKASIAGSGHVYYKGNANVTSDIAGSGGVERKE